MVVQCRYDCIVPFVFSRSLSSSHLHAFIAVAILHSLIVGSMIVGFDCHSLTLRLRFVLVLAV